MRSEDLRTESIQKISSNQSLRGMLVPLLPTNNVTVDPSTRATRLELEVTWWYPVRYVNIKRNGYPPPDRQTHLQELHEKVVDR